MKLPRDLNAANLIGVLCRHFSYTRVHEVGSHVILETEEPLIIESQFQIIIQYASER